jgi:flagellar biosynthesis/type III secretory pathway chaperone
MEPDACQDYLASLLNEEVEALGQLEALLQQEHEVLGAQNLAAIERIAVIRQERIGALARTEERRRSLCTMHGHTADWIGLERLMQWCDPQGSLIARLRECAKRASRCRDLNDRNGTLVAARLKHVAGLLSVLTGRQDQSMTYGPTGSPSSLHPTRELGAA